jgi:S1-C subfamily serine protease
MKRVVGYGLVLLAATVAASRGAWAWDGGPQSAAGSGSSQFFIGGAAAAASHSTQGYLGVDVRDVTPEQLPVLKLRDAHGAEITLVDHDAPAGKAGLREHDVILQMNGQAIEGRDQIRRMLHESPPGKSITLLISRDGQQLTLTTQLTTQEEVERQALQHLTVPDAQPSNTAADPGYTTSSSPAPHAGNSFIGTLLMNPSYTGAMLEKMSTQQAAYFGVTSGEGLLVRTVVPNSPAAIAGMQVCDVIVRANDRPVATTGDWAKALKNSRGKSLTIVVLRDKKEQTLTLTPDSKRRSSLDQPDDSSGSAIARLGLSWMSRS